jgi:tRNA A-37 threonylcarbamoyl transferase component Bud32
MDKNDRPGNETSKGRPDTHTVNFDKPDAMVGQRLDGRFLIEKNLTDDGADAGGIGVVYLARDLKLMDKEVVVKILQEETLLREDNIRKFLHEKEALIRLDHPGVVRILDTGALTDGNPFMVMEYIKGRSLRKELHTKGQLSFDLAAHVIESITDALSAAHAEKILHRDIKPANIMLTPQEGGLDRVRLIDFGIARVEESELAPVTIVRGLSGTPHYMAPEQLAGELHLTPAADIYATAIVAYEVLTGNLPFNPKSIPEMYHLEKEGARIPPRQLRPDLPLEAESILLSALQFDAAKRPQNARAFGRELAGALRKAAVKDNQKTAKGAPGRATKEVSPFDLTDFTTVNRQQDLVGPTTEKKAGLLKWLAAAVILAVLFAVPAGYFLVKGLRSADPNLGRNTNQDAITVPADQGTERELTYFLMVQKMRDGKPFEAPFQSSGREVYETGYKFTLSFTADANGYMYLFNEGPDTQGQTGYYLLFPTKSANDGLSQVVEGRVVTTSQVTFTGDRGTEVMWMIWTKEKRGDLEAIAASVVVKPGLVKGENVNSLLSFIGEQYKPEKTESSKDSDDQRTIVKGRGDVVVHRFELEHR